MRNFLSILMISSAALSVAAGPVDEAKRLYNEGEYEQACERLEPVVRKSPRDGNANYWLGASLVALGRNEEALKYLTVAEDRGVANAAIDLATVYTGLYRPTEASEHLDTYERLMRKNKRTLPEDLDERRSHLVTMENMLARVENIAVIDSIVVDADQFFTHYRLSPEAGRLINGATARLPEVEMVYMPQNNTEILYAMPDTAGTYVLMGADILDDGSVDQPAPLGGDLGGGGNAEYPFLLSDGLTLYYANDGEGSLGGYDIFLTRRNEDNEFLQPQNIGMPYNSPDDDYLLAIDETTGVGWWATDRNHIPGKLTIYIFVPSDTRVNVAADDPNIVSLARLDNIALTRKPGVDYSSLLSRIDAIGNSASRPASAAAAFELPIGSTTRIYHNLSDFKSPQARELMAQAINARVGITKSAERLDSLRRQYAAGDHNVAMKINDLEQELDETRRNYQSLINKAIAAELAVINR